MNSSLTKALISSMLAVGGCASAIGQAIPQSPGGYDWDWHCRDVNSTTSPYSAGFTTLFLTDGLFSAGLGIVGTVTYKDCTFQTTATGVNVQGRIGFANGAAGSVQDDFRLAMGDPEVNMDNGATVNVGMNTLTDPADPFAFPTTSPFETGGEATSGSGWSFADVVTQTPATGNTGPGNLTQTFTGSSGYPNFWIGASNRYIFAANQISNNIDVKLTIDLLGDAARCTWVLTNNGTAATNVGLYFSQWVYITGGYGYGPSGPQDNYEGFSGDTYPGVGGDKGDGIPAAMGWNTPEGSFQPYGYMPGAIPIRKEVRMQANPSPGSGIQQMPAYIAFTGGLIDGDSFTGDPALGPGFEIVNQPIPDVEDSNGQSDQTPVDEVDIGDAQNNFTGGFNDGVANPTVAITPQGVPNLLPDNDPGDLMEYTQRWEPALVQGNGGSRTIISYYKSIWGDSTFQNGYTVVADTPKAISVNRTAPQGFNYPPNAVTSTGVPYLPIQVDVDNTGAFNLAPSQVQMNDVKVTLQLPQGLSNAYNPGQTQMINYITSIGPGQVGSTVFYITADPTVQGNLQYTVTVDPNPGLENQVTGYINVGATAQLQINQGANLVTVPYTLTAQTWNDAFSNAGIVQGQDFQAFVWDPNAGQYDVSTGPVRGQGEWVIANVNHGFIPLGGNPQTPANEFPPQPASSASALNLSQGWNLIADPYNYSIPLGQLIGVGSSTSAVETYDQLVADGSIDGSLSYYDPSEQTYNSIGADTDRMIPNFGYWIYANEPLYLQFPPVYDLFVRTADKPKPFVQRFYNWKLQLSAWQDTVADRNNFVGLTTNKAIVPSMLRVRKAPATPFGHAMRCYITDPGATVGQGNGLTRVSSGQYTTVMHTTLGRQTFNFNVYTQEAAATTIYWPNLAQIPSNLDVKIKDTATNTTIDARKQDGYSFYSNPGSSIRTFAVAITPLGTPRESIGQVSTHVQRVGSTRRMPISFTASVQGGATITVYQGSNLIATVANDMTINSGSNSLSWPMELNSGKLASSGNYTLVIQATGEGGDTTTKLVNFRL